MTPRSIRTKKQYAISLRRFELLMDRNPEPYSIESDEMIMLSVFLKRYEQERFKFDRPSARATIKIEMQNRNLTISALAKRLKMFPSQLSSILKGRQGISKNAMKWLHRHFNISYETLMDCKIHDTI